MPLEIRPQSGGIPYNPDRDLAYMFTSLCREAFALLRSDVINQSDVELLERDGKTAGDALHDVVQAVAQSFSYYVGPGKSSSLQDALDRAGYWKLPHASRCVFESALGRVLLVHGFTAMRTVTVVGQLPPCACGFLVPMVAAELLLDPAAYTAAVKVDAAVELESLRLSVQALEKENERLYRRLSAVSTAGNTDQAS